MCKSITVRNINSLVEDSNLSRGAFADMVGIPRSNLSKILNGKYPCGEGVINKIVLATGVNKSWLKTGEGEKYPNGSPKTRLSEMLKNFPENSENLLKQSEKEERNNSIDELINQKIENAVMENIDKTIDTILKNVKEILKDQNEGNTNNLKILIEAVIGLVKEEDKEEIKNKLIALKKKVG